MNPRNRLLVAYGIVLLLLTLLGSWRYDVVRRDLQETSAALQQEGEANAALRAENARLKIPDPADPTDYAYLGFVEGRGAEYYASAALWQSGLVLTAATRKDGLDIWVTKTNVKKAKAVLRRNAAEHRYRIWFWDEMAGPSA